MIVFYIILITILFLMLVMLFSGQLVDNWRHELKYESMVKEPSVLERTMTPYALFMANNQLWVRGISIDQLSRIDATLETAKENEHLELLEPIFDQMLTVKAAWEAGNMYREQIQKAGK